MHNIYTANNNSKMFQPLTSDIENSNVYGPLVLETDVKALIDIKIKFTIFFTHEDIKLFHHFVDIQMAENILKGHTINCSIWFIAQSR